MKKWSIKKSKRVTRFIYFCVSFHVLIVVGVSGHGCSDVMIRVSYSAYVEVVTANIF